MRIVLDTNVLLAGLATHGLCEALLVLCYRDHEVVSSEHILSEVAEHYEGKFRATPEQVAVAARALRRQSQMVSPAEIPTSATADPDDLPILGTAVAGHVECIIAGDHALLALAEYRGIAILSPPQFHDRIRS